MTPVVFDTNVISETVRSRPDKNVMRFIGSCSEPFLSAVTLHELTFGAERAPDAKRRGKLLVWIAGVREQFEGRIIEVDADIAVTSGRLGALAAAAGRKIGALDTLIAACAIARGAQVATRNIKDFAPLGVPLIDPWSA